MSCKQWLAKDCDRLDEACVSDKIFLAPRSDFQELLRQHQATTMSDSSPSKPILLHLGADIRWNHDLYTALAQKYTIIRTHSASREAFKRALQDKTWGDFTAMYRPFWNTGGEMGNWDNELM